jgi:hypothetical protein
MELEVNEAKLARPGSLRWAGSTSGAREASCTSSRVEDECAAEARKMSMLVMGISSALVDLEVLPIQNISQLLKMAQEVLVEPGLVLECLREEHASDASP